MLISNFSSVQEGDDYSLTLLTTDGFNTASTESGIFCVDNDLSVCGLKLLNNTGLNVIFEFTITNNLNSTLNNINWTLNTGATNITSNINFNLTSKEDIFVYAEHVYNQSGSYNVTAIANANGLLDNQTTSITI